jgi:hypothetical protein
MEAKDNKKKLNKAEKAELLAAVTAKFKKGSANSLLQYIERRREAFRKANS